MKSKKILILLIITNIILLGFICSFININGDIIREKQIVKEMSESTQVTDLNNQINSLNTEHTEYMNYIQTCKTAIATALTNEGVETSDQETLETMADNISRVLQAKTKDVTATAEDIANGKTAYVNGELVIGNNNGGQSVLQLVTNGNTSAIIKNCDVYCGEWSLQTKATDGQILQSHTSWGGTATIYTSLIDLTNYSYIYYYSVPTSYGNYSWSQDGLYLIDSNNNAIAINQKGYSGFADIKNYNGEYKIQLSADCYAQQGYHSYLTLYYLYLISIPE